MTTTSIINEARDHMDKSVKALQHENVVQQGISAAQRQQIDINTAHLTRNDVDHREIMRTVDKMEATMDYWRHVYNWKLPGN